MLEVEEFGGVGVAEAVTGDGATSEHDPGETPQRRSFVPGDVYRLYAEVYALRLQQ